MNRLRGINLGGWLLMEGYILGGRNIPQGEFEDKFKKIYGRGALDRFLKLFRDNFITEKDIITIKSWNVNCIRVPFHYRVAEREVSYLEKLLIWAKKHGLKVILDLHAAYGSQNKDWHSDSRGIALLWKSKELRLKTISLWERLATLFKGYDSLYGYDILNEPVIEKEKLGLLVKLYKEIVRKIRSIDTKKIIFLEGNMWATKIDFLEELLTENVQISIHTYQPLNFTFNFIPYLKYPGKIDNVFWDRDRIYRYLAPYYRFSQKNKTKIFVGEFGINWRGGFWGEKRYLSHILDIFEEFGFSYTYWTYKSIKTYVFPDGVFQFLKNPPYVSREGPNLGWENYMYLWQKKKKEIIKSWRTENYFLNTSLFNILKRYFRKNKEDE